MERHIKKKKSKLQHNEQCDTFFFKGMCTNAQKRSWRKHIKPWTVVSSGGLGEVDKRKELITFYLLGSVGMFYKENISTSYKSVSFSYTVETVETIKRSVVARVWWEGKLNKEISGF